MKKTVLTMALFLSASAFAAEDEQKCHTEIERAGNPIFEMLSIPFKAVAAFSHLPRCLIDHFPVNEDR
ncbi:MAG: hypothetical protein ACR2QC_11340 [Gammaproteobacteria bacterium]